MNENEWMRKVNIKGSLSRKNAASPFPHICLQASLCISGSRDSDVRSKAQSGVHVYIYIYVCFCLFVCLLLIWCLRTQGVDTSIPVKVTLTDPGPFLPVQKGSGSTISFMSDTFVCPMMTPLGKGWNKITTEACRPLTYKWGILQGMPEKEGGINEGHGAIGSWRSHAEHSGAYTLWCQHSQ